MHRTWQVTQMRPGIEPAALGNVRNGTLPSLGRHLISLPRVGRQSVYTRISLTRLARTNGRKHCAQAVRSVVQRSPADVVRQPVSGLSIWRPIGLEKSGRFIWHRGRRVARRAASTWLFSIADADSCRWWSLRKKANWRRNGKYSERHRTSVVVRWLSAALCWSGRYHLRARVRAFWVSIECARFWSSCTYWLM